MNDLSASSKLNGFSWERLSEVSVEDPLRILSSACLLGHKVGWDDRPYTSSVALALKENPKVKMFHFCPEDLILGTPRLLTTVHNGNGFDVLDGQATVLDTEGVDHTSKFVFAAEQMLHYAKKHAIELALLTEISDSCGSTALYLGAAENKNYQRGMGVSAALLHRNGIPIVGARDFRSLQQIMSALDPTMPLDHNAQNFDELDWYLEYFSGDETDTSSD